MTRQIECGFSPVNRVPRDVSGLVYAQIVDMGVSSWGPTLPKDGPATEVHFRLRLEGEPGPFVLRIKTPAAADELVRLIQWHRNEVWPTPSAQGGAT